MKPNSPPICFAVCGERRAGKTRTLQTLAERLIARSVRVVGVIQPAREKEGRVVGYDLLDVASGARLPFASRTDQPCGGMCFRFRPDGFSWAAERITALGEVLIVDEIGLLEARGKGHFPALAAAFEKGAVGAVVLGLRKDVSATVHTALRGHVGQVQIFTVPDENDEAPVTPLSQAILEVIR
jgi:nucleoside-triphosphatase THEP1